MRCQKCTKEFPDSRFLIQRDFGWRNLSQMEFHLLAPEKLEICDNCMMHIFKKFCGGLFIIHSGQHL